MNSVEGGPIGASHVGGFIAVVALSVDEYGAFVALLLGSGAPLGLGRPCGLLLQLLGVVVLLLWDLLVLLALALRPLNLRLLLSLLDDFLMLCLYPVHLLVVLDAGLLLFLLPVGDIEGLVLGFGLLAAVFVAGHVFSPGFGPGLGQFHRGLRYIGLLHLEHLRLGHLCLGQFPLGWLLFGHLPLVRLPLGRLPLGTLPLGRFHLGWLQCLGGVPLQLSSPPLSLVYEVLEVLPLPCFSWQRRVGESFHGPFDGLPESLVAHVRLSL